MSRFLFCGAGGIVSVMLREIFLFLYRIEQKLLGNLGLGRLPLVKKIKRAIFSRIQPSTAEVWGMTFHLDLVYGFTDPAIYKKPVADLLQEEIKAGDVVVDVGANIGLFTCLMAKLVGPKGKVYAFEPEPKNLELLQKNIVGNNLGNIVVSQKALSNMTGRLKITSEGAHASLSIAAKGFDDATEVELMRLDDVPEIKKGHITLIKMDIIGYEVKALDGMRDTLSRNKNTVIVSAFCPAFLKRVEDSGEKYLEDLSQLGFKIYQVTKTGLSEITPDKFDEFIRKHNPRGGIAQAEIFCRRG